MKLVRGLVIASYFGVATLPLLWLALTSLKTTRDALSTAPRILPAASSEGRLTFAVTTEGYRELADPLPGMDHGFFSYLGNSLIIGLLSTLASVALGTGCAYGFSRFRIAGAKDWLFFILSTRFLPPLAVVVPVVMMYKRFDLQNTHVGLILLYTCFNLSLSVWLMKGFIDEIPKAYEEAALVDGYTRLQAFRAIIVPQAATGMAVTAVFCLISAWNEYGFAMTLNDTQAVTVPRYLLGIEGTPRTFPWPQVAAGTILFVAPIVVFTVLVRKHLLRGVTFGTIKQ
jgi:multiple sugar transport system permease protein